MEKFLERKLSFISNQSIRAFLVFAIDILINIIVIVILVYGIRGYLISPFQVYGPSMCDTLNYLDNHCERANGEYIIVNKAVYQNFFNWQVGTPQRGDIIVFRPPQNDKEFFIKRVIGLPGETVKLIDGYVYIFNDRYPQGYKLEEPYLNSTNQGKTLPTPGETSVFQVPDGQFFVMGDNRTESSDSRACFKETLINQYCKRPEASHYLKPEEIEGRAWVVLWPFSKMGILEPAKYGL